MPGVQAFEAAARLGSFAAAAAELHLSPAAVSQRIRSLETHLGVPLFERLARSVELAELGRAYLPAVCESLDDLAVANSGLFAPARREQLTVRTQVSYATTWLAPHLHLFQAEHPEIDLRLVSAVWSKALVPGEVDLDVHQGRGASQRPCPAAAPRRRRRRPRPRPRPALRSVPRRRRPRRTAPRASPRLRRRLATPAVVRTHGSGHHRRHHHHRAGSGCCGDASAAVPERFARAAVRSGRVSLALAQSFPMRQAHYLLRPLDDPTPTVQARAFLLWLARLDDHLPALPLVAEVDIG